jgi:hypothetical protein
MDEDPVIEVRRIREELARKFNYDVMAAGRYFMRRQVRSGHPLVDLPTTDDSGPRKTASRQSAAVTKRQKPRASKMKNHPTSKSHGTSHQ